MRKNEAHNHARGNQDAKKQDQVKSKFKTAEIIMITYLRSASCSKVCEGRNEVLSKNLCFSVCMSAIISVPSMTSLLMQLPRYSCTTESIVLRGMYVFGWDLV